MGLDYIRAHTGKPWRKRWHGGLDRLKAPTLLDLTMTESARTVTAELNAGAHVKAGGQLALAGILPPQIDRITDAYAPWIAMTVTAERDGWVRMSGTRAP